MDLKLFTESLHYYIVINYLKCVIESVLQLALLLQRHSIGAEE